MNGLDEQEFCDELELVARNDGEMFRDGKNAKAAVIRAFIEFQARRREEESEMFAKYCNALAKQILGYWTEGE